MSFTLLQPQVNTGTELVVFSECRSCSENILNLFNDKTFLSVVVPQSISGPASDIAEGVKSIFLVLSLMLPKTISRPESFIAEVAGDDDSFKMVCFNVIFYGTFHAFLSTHFALHCMGVVSI